MDSQQGTIFDIKEFAIYDGPGIRTTVFMKGCPLRCQWCHNPEGLAFEPQLLVNQASCTHCNACRRVCTHDSCIACGGCVPMCRKGLRRISGEIWESHALAKRLLQDAPVLRSSGGGVTFSGGEPLAQWNFVRDVIAGLDGLHTCLETSGYSSDPVFRDAMARASMILMDIKLMDPAAHKKWTGVDNAAILRHGKMLCEGDTPFVFRIPVIPGVNDNNDHFQSVARLCKGAKALQRVELLPYHKTAGAKYAMAGMEYKIAFNADQPVYINTRPFEEAGIPFIIM